MVEMQDTVYVVNKAHAWRTIFLPLNLSCDGKKFYKSAKNSVNQLHKKFHKSAAKRGCALIEACAYITTYTVPQFLHFLKY